MFLFNRSGKTYRWKTAGRSARGADGSCAMIPGGTRRCRNSTPSPELLLRSPLLWGGALAFAFFSLIHGGVISDPTVIRYLAGHWVEYAEVTLFCVGLAALVIRAGDLVGQQRGWPRRMLGPIPAGGEDPAAAAELPPRIARRARAICPAGSAEALDLVVRTGSADGLEDHLKYLADVDAARAAQGYGLVRFIVWAIPIMGFLGHGDRDHGGDRQPLADADGKHLRRGGRPGHRLRHDRHRPRRCRWC